MDRKHSVVSIFSAKITDLLFKATVAKNVIVTCLSYPQKALGNNSLWTKVNAENIVTEPKKSSWVKRKSSREKKQKKPLSI